MAEDHHAGVAELGAQVERLHELVAVQVVDRTGAAIVAATAQAEDEIGRERRPPAT